MFETSGDILNLVIAISVLLFTVFLVWTIYYVLASLKKVYKIVNELDKGVKKALETIDTIKEKVNKSTSYLYVAGEVAKKVVNLMKDKVTNFHDEDEDEEEITKKKPKRGRKNRR
jgi:uncharacterized protein YoxC